MLRSPFIVISLVTVLGFASSALGEVQTPSSRIWNRSRIVTPGQKIWGFNTSYQRVNSRFSEAAGSEPLGAPFTRAITWDQLLAAEPTAAGRAELQSYMRSSGLSGSDVAATADYEVEQEDIAFRLDWAYGLTKRWMIGFEVPFVRRRTNVRTRITEASSLNGGMASGQKASLLSNPRDNVRSRMKDIAQRELKNSGYDDVPDQETEWQWGDINLISQWGLAEDYGWAWSLQTNVRFPAARNPSLDEYIQLSTDSGNVDWGVTSMIDFARRRWLVGWRLGYVVQVPDAVQGRSSGRDSRDIDPRMSRDLGDWAWTSIESEWRLSRRIDLIAEYAFLQKESDRLRGVTVRGSDQQLHLAKGGVQFDLSLPSARGGIESKWMAATTYTVPIAGRNSIDAGRVGFDLITHF